MKKILIVNFIFILSFFILLEIGSFFLAINELLNNEKNDGVLKRDKGGNVFEAVYKTYTQTPFFSYEHSKNKLHQLQGKEYNKKPILLFGCSVTYGNLLDENKNFSGILSKETKRPVYNFSYDGWGPAHMLKLLSEDKRLLFIKDPEYIIYTYINDHKRRIVSSQGWPYSSQLYKIYDVDKNNNLIEVPRKYPFYWRFLCVKNFQSLKERILLKNEKYVNNLLFKIFEKSVSIFKSRYPNAKLILLLYDVKICFDNENHEISNSEDILSKEEIEKFQNMGFVVYNIEEIAEKSFCGVDYHAHCPIYGDVDYNHPSTKMWEEFVPKLVEKLDM